MARRARLFGCLLVAALVPGVATLAGCNAQSVAHLSVSGMQSISGRIVGWFPQRSTLAISAEVADGATVSLIDATTGKTLGSSVSDVSGNFNVVFPAFNPTPGVPYVLEAVKGLSAGGAPNRAGAHAARLRTLMICQGGWQSLTGNAATNVTVCAATTAVAIAANYHQAAGQAPNWSALIGSVDPNANTFRETGTLLSNANDFQVLLPLVQNALAADRDPIGAIAYAADKGAYAYDQSLPAVAEATPAIGVRGGSVTLYGDDFDAPAAGESFVFNGLASSNWTRGTDDRSVTIPVPASAVTGPLTYQRSDVTQTIDPFFKIHGTTALYAGTPLAPAADTDGQRLSAQFMAPYAITKDLQGNLLVADENAGTIRKITPGGVVSTVAGTGTQGYVNGPATTARFACPAGLAVGPDGTIYAAEFTNHCIRKIDTSGNVTTFAGSLAGTPGYADGQGTAARFNQPVGLAFGPNGNLYVADSANHRIRMIASDGTVSTVLGNGTGANVTPGVGTTTADMLSPYSLVFDGQGRLYIGDEAFGAYDVDLASNTLSILAGSHAYGYQEGQGGNAIFNHVGAIAVDTTTHLVYVTDTYNDCIRTIDTGGNTLLLAGMPSTPGFLDGANAAAKFNLPSAMMLDQGFLYVTDRQNNCLRVVTP